MRSEIKLERLAKVAQKYRGQKSGTAQRWPDEVKEKAIKLMSSGEATAHGLSQRLGISTSTIASWKGRSEKKPRRADFIRLKVVDRPRSNNQTKGPVKIFVTTSLGSEIHGFTLEDLERLVKKGII